METQLSYSEIQVNGTYNLLNAKVGPYIYNKKEISIIDKHISIICSNDYEVSKHEERIIYCYLDNISTRFSVPFKDLVITY
jgi:hypothetical protein